MGILYDAVKKLFGKKNNTPTSEPKKEVVQGYWINEWSHEPDREVKTKRENSIDKLRCSIPLGNLLDLKTVQKKPYNNKLAVKKKKSQFKKWSRWRVK